MGALSAADWNTFNDKIELTSLSGAGFILYDNLTGLITWSGSTTDITEGTNLYFTNSRAQDALSGTVDTLSGRITTTENTTSSLSGRLLTLGSDLSALSGSLSSLANTVDSLSGIVTQNSLAISSLSGGLATTNSTLSNLSSVVDTLSG